MRAKTENKIKVKPSHKHFSKMINKIGKPLSRLPKAN